MPMKEFVCTVILVFAMITSVGAAPSENNINNYFFNTDLPPPYETFLFREFPFTRDKQMTSLGQAFLTILQNEIEWKGEPRVFIKENHAYIRIAKIDGLQNLYSLKNTNGNWQIINKETKKVSDLNNQILEATFVRAIGLEVGKAIAEHTCKSGQFYPHPKIIEIKQDERQDTYFLTVQAISFKGAHNPPYGLETMTFKIPGFHVVKYEHKDITNDTRIHTQ
jgi:hypothetical protein